ncbi:hypothetical protein FN846DRAFT_904501 [Sphaerosporella brunnea]|uniref:Uncharacterized protein n=1 Tax=Sphaerosporella brunnea TaxID=1250544 RepID=A0A5J5F4L9_9PEZI|nr:hypothetical protein FN846DRAFT_904501 [Sphaerosporella brunnea]
MEQDDTNTQPSVLGMQSYVSSGETGFRSMVDIPQNKWALVAAAALGYSAMTNAQYRVICPTVRGLCPVPPGQGARCWTEMTADQHEAYLQRLKGNFPGVRDPVKFVSFVKHVLSAYKGEAKRRRSSCRPASAEDAGTGDVGKPKEEN